MIKSEKKLPVSFDFFKKYTIHEECVDYILKLKANGNQEVYEALANSERSKERALRTYYEAFYLQPNIRNKYHIRIKPVPKNIKDKLLTIPVLSMNKESEAVSEAKKSYVEISPMETVINSIDSSSNGNEEGTRNNARQILKTFILTQRDACDEYQLVDDDEPVSTPESTRNLKGSNENLNVSNGKQNPQGLGGETMPRSITVESTNEDYPPMISNNGEQNKENTAKDASTTPKNKELKYEELLPYVHCCPLALKEFRKYSNIRQLIEEYVAGKNINATEKRIIQHRSYLLFYLAPEYRKRHPMNKIQFLEDCPQHIKSKFFSIPTKLYLKAPTPANSVKDNLEKAAQNSNLSQTTSTTTLPSTPAKSLSTLAAHSSNNSNEKEATINKSDICSAPLPQTVTAATLKSNDKSDSPASINKPQPHFSGIKRHSPEVNELSAKRLKIHQKEDNANDMDKSQKSYKTLLPYIHCCPISFSEFKKYTNISALFSGYCQKRNNSIKKLPFVLHRAYVLYYLSPKYRKLKPFNKLRILDNCPAKLRDKILDIPQNLYLKEQQEDENKKNEKTNFLEKTNITDVQKADRKSKNAIEILENRTLPPIALPFCTQPRKEDTESLCPNTACVFHHISCIDFINNTNVLSILPEPQDPTVIENMFKNFIYKSLKEQSCDEKYMAQCSFMCKIFKYKEICEQCETTIDSFGSRTQEAETVTERRDINNKSLTGQEAEANSNQIQEETVARLSFKDLWKFLKTDKVFAEFCQKLVIKLNKLLENNADFSSDTYKLFLKCNEIPLRKILNDFCENDDDIVQRILNEKEVCQVLERFYYYNYLTNERFALKYPAEIKQTTTEEEEEVLNKTKGDNTENINKTINKVLNSSELASNVSGTIQRNTSNVTTNDNNSALEKAKRIFFRNVGKTNTLYYVLRTSFGLKQLILCTVLNLTFQEFLDFTNIYEGEELYNDNHLAACMYRYVFQTALVWPTNLFITLENLCKFLHKKNIRFDKYSTMLKYISPKLLHWSVLLSCTNFIDCVRIDYERRTGKLLDTYDTKSLKQECINYYNRCWKHEKWLEVMPVVNEEYCVAFLKDSEGAGTQLNTSGVQNSLTDTSQTADQSELVPNYASANCAVKPKEEERTNDDKTLEPFNCVILPSTQKQISMLPADIKIPNDPLNECSNSEFNLNVSSSIDGSYEIVCLGELTENIKSEPTQAKLLSNLIFYEDENSNIQCKVCEEEIIDLDSVVISQTSAVNLPPSQIDFEAETQEYILSDVTAHNNNSSKSNSLTNLTEHIPNPAESIDIDVDTQPFGQEQPKNTMKIISAQIMTSPEKCLQSSGEDGSQANVQDNGQELATEHTRHEQQQSQHTFYTNVPRQHIPSTCEATQTCSESSNIEQLNTSLQQEQVEASGLQHAAEIPSTCLVQVGQRQNINVTALSQSSCFQKGGLPLHTYRTIESKKKCAKVRPFKNPDLVPQIQHNTRPLQTKPAYTTSSGKCNQEFQSEAQMSSTTSNLLSLTPTNNSTNSTEPSSQSPALGAHIHISQELNENSSVFDNTSLLRLADHNYQKRNLTLLTTATSEASNKKPSEKSPRKPINKSQYPEQQNTQCANQNVEKQPGQKTTRRSSIHPDISTQPNTSSAIRQDCPKSVTNNLHNDTDDKVNNLVLIESNNLVSAYAPIIPLHDNCSYKILRKPCLHRVIKQFHYFKELTPQHICEYLLPSLEIGISYSEALVVSENFRTRISNRSILALFPFWSQSLQRDFMLVLNDLREFHYIAYDHAAMQQQEDLRARILFWLLHTAPSFSLCQFIYEANNTEFSRCESIRSGNNPSYKRKPFKCLTNAISPKILTKLKDVKLDLKRSQ